VDFQEAHNDFEGVAFALIHAATRGKWGREMGAARHHF
jgi:hypothetical protein